MNANELFVLTRELEEDSVDYGMGYLVKAATMLRQQQAEIEEWKRKYKDMHNLATQAMSRVHELEKDFHMIERHYDELNTHPVKEYKEPSVKEVDDLWLDVINNIPANDHRPREWHFANAILTKASKNE